MIFQVRPGGVGRGDIATLHGDIERAGAAMASLITLQPLSAPMIANAKAAGHYRHEMMNRNYDRIQIVTVREMLGACRRLDLPMGRDILKKAQAKAQSTQMALLSGEE